MAKPRVLVTRSRPETAEARLSETLDRRLHIPAQPPGPEDLLAGREARDRVR